MQQDNIAITVQEFIRKNFVFDEKRVVEADESLLGSGIVDSTGILELIAFLEQTYQVDFKDSELVADNFDSIKKITVFVAAKLNHSRS